MNNLSVIDFTKIEDLYQLGVTIMEPEKFANWLETPNADLGGIPSHLLQTSDGITKVTEFLEEMLDNQGYFFE